MPRYKLDPDESRALAAYVAQLGTDSAAGVDAQALHLAALVPRSGAMRGAADQAGDDVLFKIGDYRQFAAVQGAVADSVDTPVGLDLECDEIAPRTSDDDAGGFDFHVIPHANAKCMC